MKKTIYLAVLFLIIGIAATSCKKEATPVDLSGSSWRGTMTVGTMVYDSTVISFNANGKVSGTIQKSAGASSTYALEGTWNKTPNSNKVYLYHTITTAPGTFDANATLNSDNTKLEGGVGVNSISPTYNYTFTCSKI